jgi:hypothetical protein
VCVCCDSLRTWHSTSPAWIPQGPGEGGLPRAALPGRPSPGGPPRAVLPGRSSQGGPRAQPMPLAALPALYKKGNEHAAREMKSVIHGRRGGGGVRHARGRRQRRARAARRLRARRHAAWGREGRGAEEPGGARRLASARSRLHLDVLALLRLLHVGHRRADRRERGRDCVGFTRRVAGRGRRAQARRGRRAQARRGRRAQGRRGRRVGRGA